MFLLLMFMRVKIFPKDKKSVAINVTLQAINKTLSEKDLDQISKKIIDTVRVKNWRYN